MFDLNQFDTGGEDFRGFKYGHNDLGPNYIYKISVGEGGRLEPSAESKERLALRYLWHRIKDGREYVSLMMMSRHLGFSYDDCERLLAQLHVDKKIPRLAIIEDLEG